MRSTQDINSRLKKTGVTNVNKDQLRSDVLSSENLSKAEMFAALTQEERSNFISSLTKEEILQLEYSWDFWARPKQRIPSGDWYCWLICSGRGFGKTRTGAETIIKWKQQGYGLFGIVGQTKADVRDVMLLGPSGLITVSPPWDRPEYIASKRLVRWANGAVAHLYSGDEPEQLRGPQHEKGWMDELVKYRNLEELIDMWEFGLRLGDNPQYVATTTPKPTKVFKEIVADPRTIVTVGSSYENISNLSESFINRVIRKYENTRIGRQELYGELFTDVAGALWTYDTIDKNRVAVKDDHYIRIVVAVDPAVTSGEKADETGIVVAGMNVDGYVHVLEDASLRGSPEQWARKAVYMYNKWQADLMLGESNNGGDLVEFTVKTVASDVNFSKVHTHRGKYLRAEPVAALYEQGKVKHVKEFDLMETEMVQWVQGDPSPNRLDALVYGVTELAVDDRHSPGRVIPITKWF